MEAYAVAVGKQSLLLILILAAPPVLTAMIVGLFVSLIQATTQIQEQTLTFVPKMVGVVLVLILLGPQGMAQLVTFTKALFTNFPAMIQ